MFSGTSAVRVQLSCFTCLQLLNTSTALSFSSLHGAFCCELNKSTSQCDTDVFNTFRLATD